MLVAKLTLNNPTFCCCEFVIFRSNGVYDFAFANKGTFAGKTMQQHLDVDNRDVIS